MSECRDGCIKRCGCVGTAKEGLVIVLVLLLPRNICIKLIKQTIEVVPKRFPTPPRKLVMPCKLVTVNFVMPCTKMVGTVWESTMNKVQQFHMLWVAGGFVAARIVASPCESFNLYPCSLYIYTFTPHFTTHLRDLPPGFVPG